jgi:hypothetical protein
LTIYDLLKLLVDDSTVSDKEQAHRLLRELETLDAFGSVASTVSVAGDGHVHIRQEEPFDNLRHVIRCGVCRVDLTEPFFPQYMKGLH